ncbi:MAG: D-alanine--D-alanine ligase [Candidatus Hydrogenedentes bacterium]|nr:D-alanine--D-alanine ligase [Candidatus Hydrogenedentota bacterium]
MSKTHVAVLMGGVSSEHEVSLKSGAMVAGSLDRARYDVTPVVITRDGTWKFPGEHQRDVFQALPLLLTQKVDCVFIALHGPYGEDGRVQGLLDYLKIPYTGSGCAASALAMDKIHSKAVVRQAGVTVAKDFVLNRAEWDANADTVLARVESEIGFPCLIKSPCQGSSLGMAIPRNAEDFRKSLLNVLVYDDRVLVEKFVKGPEITCSVLDVEPGKPPRALPLTEICPVDSTFFDYHAKYTPGACKEITPARISPEATKRAQEMAVCVHNVIGCSGLSRSDMILDGDQPMWIEVNTLPGMTETSLFPQAAAATGIPFAELTSLLVENALAKAHT